MRTRRGSEILTIKGHNIEVVGVLNILVIDGIEKIIIYQRYEYRGRYSN